MSSYAVFSSGTGGQGAAWPGSMTISAMQPSGYRVQLVQRVWISALAVLYLAKYSSCYSLSHMTGCVNVVD